MPHGRTSYFLIVLDLADGKGDVEAALAMGDDLLCEHEATVAAFRERWFAGNRHAEIEVTLDKLAHAAEVLRAVQHWLLTHRLDLAAGTPVPLPTVPEYQPPWKEDLSILWSFDVVQEAEVR